MRGKPRHERILPPPTIDFKIVTSLSVPFDLSCYATCTVCRMLDNDICGGNPDGRLNYSLQGVNYSLQGANDSLAGMDCPERKELTLKY